MSNLCFLIHSNLFSVLIALILDLIFGDPSNRFHPICLIGNLISFFEKKLYQNSFLSGASVASLVIIIVTFTAFALLTISYLISPYLFIITNICIIYFGISIKSLSEHAMTVKQSLNNNNLQEAKEKLAFMVSRDTKDMNEQKIVTSAVESVSENFVDGVVSPILFASIFGGVGVAFFKAVSTMDSMIGYKNEKYLLFGRFAARLDDVLNFIPARFSIISIYLGAYLLKLDHKECLVSFKADRKKHASPNSAHAMSAFAGAIGIALGGITSYDNKEVIKPLMGKDIHSPQPKHITEAVELMKLASILTLIFSIFTVYILI